MGGRTQRPSSQRLGIYSPRPGGGLRRGCDWKDHVLGGKWSSVQGLPLPTPTLGSSIWGKLSTTLFAHLQNQSNGSHFMHRSGACERAKATLGLHSKGSSSGAPGGAGRAQAQHPPPFSAGLHASTALPEPSKGVHPRALLPEPQGVTHTLQGQA